MNRWMILGLALCVACAGEELPHDEWGCTSLDNADPIVATRRADQAPTIGTGLRAYRVTLPEEGTGFVAFDAPGGAVQILMEESGQLASVQQGADVAELVTTTHPSCPLSIAEVTTVVVGAGRQAIKLGPSEFADLWISVGPIEE